MWMIEQANNNTNIFVDYNVISNKNWNIVTNPIVHDSVGVTMSGYTFSGPDRNVKYTVTGQETQQTFSGGDLSTAKARTYFDQRYMRTIGSGRNRRHVKGIDKARDRTLVGLVGVSGAETYQNWLKNNYGLNINITHGIGP